MGFRIERAGFGRLAANEGDIAELVFCHRDQTLQAGVVGGLLVQAVQIVKRRRDELELERRSLGKIDQLVVEFEDDVVGENLARFKQSQRLVSGGLRAGTFVNGPGRQPGQGGGHGSSRLHKSNGLPPLVAQESVVDGFPLDLGHGGNETDESVFPGFLHAFFLFRRHGWYVAQSKLPGSKSLGEGVVVLADVPFENDGQDVLFIVPWDGEKVFDLPRDFRRPA